MTTIGILDPLRLGRIPKKFWSAHEFSFFLHDSILRAFVEYEKSGVHNWVTDALAEVLKEQNFEEEFDILEFMKNENLIDAHKHHILSHIVFALVGDMLNFIYEAFIAFEKRKFTVGWALLRKPFKENLLYLSWIIANEDEFLRNFEVNTSLKLNNPDKEKRVEIFKLALERIPNKDYFDGDLLQDLIFSKSLHNGFEYRWQRATHLITTHGALLKTEDYSLNLIFEDPFSDHQFEALFQNLPHLMMYLSSITLECFNRILKMNEATYDHTALISVACYEALFAKQRDLPILRAINKNLKPFLKCIHCGKEMKVTKKNAPSMYIKDQLTCDKCGVSSAFPFYWLMAQAKGRIYPVNRRSLTSMQLQKRDWI